MSRDIDYPKLVAKDVSVYLEKNLKFVESRERTTHYPEKASWAKLVDALKRSIRDVRSNCIAPK